VRCTQLNARETRRRPAAAVLVSADHGARRGRSCKESMRQTVRTANATSPSCLRPSCCACARAMLAKPRFWRRRDTPSRSKIEVPF